MAVAVPVLAMMRKTVCVRCGQDAPPMVVVVVVQQLVLRWKRAVAEIRFSNCSSVDLTAATCAPKVEQC